MSTALEKLSGQLADSRADLAGFARNLATTWREGREWTDAQRKELLDAVDRHMALTAQVRARVSEEEAGQSFQLVASAEVAR